MEFASGGSLEQKLEKLKNQGGILTKERALKFFTMMSLGVLDIHNSNILHRDLSPKNIFIKEFDKNRELLIIGDFGTAKSIFAKHTVNSLMDVFTPRYASPEQNMKVKATI